MHGFTSGTEEQKERRLTDNEWLPVSYFFRPALRLLDTDCCLKSKVSDSLSELLFNG